MMFPIKPPFVQDFQVPYVIPKVQFAQIHPKSHPACDSTRTGTTVPTCCMNRAQSAPWTVDQLESIGIQPIPTDQKNLRRSKSLNWKSTAVKVLGSASPINVVSENMGNLSNCSPTFIIFSPLVDRLIIIFPNFPHLVITRTGATPLTSQGSQGTGEEQRGRQRGLRQHAMEGAAHVLRRDQFQGRVLGDQWRGLGEPGGSWKT